LIPIKNDNTMGITGWCLEVHDLVVSKYVAGRQRDLEFASDTVQHGLVEKELLLQRVSMLPVEQAMKDRVRGRALEDFRSTTDLNTPRRKR
jgi:hypothetical protein